MDEKKVVGRPKKERKKLSNTPAQFDPDPEFGLTGLQSAFVWHYTEGSCGQTEAARRAGFEFPANAASKMLNGRDFPKVTKAIRFKQDELADKYAVTPQKTGAMLWKIAEEAFEAGHFASSVTAIKELNSLAGLIVNKSQTLNINANLDSMNRDDIKERIGKLLGADLPRLDDSDY